MEKDRGILQSKDWFFKGDIPPLFPEYRNRYNVKGHPCAERIRMPLQ